MRPRALPIATRVVAAAGSSGGGGTTNPTLAADYIVGTRTATFNNINNSPDQINRWEQTQAALNLEENDKLFMSIARSAPMGIPVTDNRGNTYSRIGNVYDFVQSGYDGSLELQQLTAFANGGVGTDRSDIEPLIQSRSSFATVIGHVMRAPFQLKALQLSSSTLAQDSTNPKKYGSNIYFNESFLVGAGLHESANALGDILILTSAPYDGVQYTTAINSNVSFGQAGAARIAAQCPEYSGVWGTVHAVIPNVKYNEIETLIDFVFVYAASVNPNVPELPPFVAYLIGPKAP